MGMVVVVDEQASFGIHSEDKDKDTARAQGSRHSVGGPSMRLREPNTRVVGNVKDHVPRYKEHPRLLK